LQLAGGVDQLVALRLFEGFMFGLAAIAQNLRRLATPTTAISGSVHRLERV
jgi:hypothetical protein